MRRYILLALSSLALAIIVAACVTSAASTVTGTPAADSSSGSPGAFTNPFDEFAQPLDGFLKAASAGDIDAVRQWMSDDLNKAQTKEQTAIDLSWQPYRFKAYESVTVQEKTFADQSHAQVKGIVKYSDGREGSLVATMVKQSDGWKIWAIRVNVAEGPNEEPTQAAQATIATMIAVVSEGSEPGWKLYQLEGASISLPDYYSDKEPISTALVGVKAGESYFLAHLRNGDVTGDCVLSSSAPEATLPTAQPTGSPSAEESGGTQPFPKERIELPSGDADKSVIRMVVGGRATLMVIYEMVRGDSEWNLMLSASSQSGPLDEAKYLPVFDKIAQSLTFAT